MGSSNKRGDAVADATKKSSSTAAARRSPAPSEGGGGARVVLAIAALVGIVLGAGASYFVAAAQFNEQAKTIAEASEIRVQAAEQRVAELQDEIRQFEEQADRRQQAIQQDADAQRSRLVRQITEQNRALVQKQSAQIEQAKARERDLAKPDLPLRLWVHRPLIGKGLVASMHNFGTKDVPLTITTHRAASGTSDTWTTVIPANANQVVGVEPGLAIAPGDEIDLVSNDYRSMNFQVPQRAKSPAPAPQPAAR